jgi:hypothetical protein
MKWLRNLPRVWRDIIGMAAMLGGGVVWMWIFNDEGLAFIFDLPLIFFCIWLCPELWCGK